MCFYIISIRPHVGTQGDTSVGAATSSYTSMEPSSRSSQLPFPPPPPWFFLSLLLEMKGVRNVLNCRNVTTVSSSCWISNYLRLVIGVMLSGNDTLGGSLRDASSLWNGVFSLVVLFSVNDNRWWVRWGEWIRWIICIHKKVLGWIE